MRMSVGTKGNLWKFAPVDVGTFEDFEEIILSRPYSLGLFKDNHRTLENFYHADAIGLDIDEGVTLEQAAELFKDYRHVIATTKNHQKIKYTKSGKAKPACDRFRVIVFLTKPITDIDTFYSTWFHLDNLFPHLDGACKDASRYFDESPNIYSVNLGGLRIEPVPPNIKEKREVTPVELSPGQKGELSKQTLKFLFEGAPLGSRHKELYKAARDSHQQGYNEDWFLKHLHAVSEKIGDVDLVDDGALASVKDAFTKEPKHEPRIKEKAFKLVSIEDLYREEVRKEWLIDGLLTKSGIGLMVGEPKVGKSTIVRQIQAAVAHGAPFLGRRVQKGSVQYYAMEEQIDDLQPGFKKLGVTGADEIKVHIGDIEVTETFDEFKDNIVTLKPDLVVVDTMFDLISVENENSYRELKKELKRFRKIARESGSHILFIHHTNKPSFGDKRRGNRAILGSQAIAGAMDTIIVIEKEGRERLITTSGRGVQSWEHRRLVWNKEKCSYDLGPETSDKDMY